MTDSTYYFYPPAPVPGKGMGIVALVLSLLNIIAIPSALAGAIVGHIAWIKTRRANAGHNIPALIAIIFGWLFTVIDIIVFIIVFSAIASLIHSVETGFGGFDRMFALISFL